MSTRHRTARWIFAAAWVVALGGAVAMLALGRWEPALRFAAVVVVVTSVRRARVPLPFAAGFAALLLLGASAWALHWYQQVSQFDVLVHFLLPGSLAAVGYFLLVQARVLPGVQDPPGALRSWAPVVWVTIVGVSAAVVWEFYEWVFEQINPAGMTVGYTDTIVDLLAGMLGSLAAGGLVLWWGRQHQASPAPPARASARRPAPGRSVGAARPQ